MAKEIEHKYLVRDNSYEQAAISSVRMIQGYLSRRKEATVRVRVAGDEAFLTVKGITAGAVRDEWEYPVPKEDAMQMLGCCAGGIIDKTRYIVPFGGLRWEVDRFHGPLEGLVVAEVELPSADTVYEKPAFAGEDVTGDARYYNSALVSATTPPRADRAE